MFRDPLPGGPKVQNDPHLRQLVRLVDGQRVGHGGNMDQCDGLPHELGKMFLRNVTSWMGIFPHLQQAILILQSVAGRGAELQLAVAELLTPR